MLYPQGLPPAQRLPYYFGQFQTVELNASFYRWPANRPFAMTKSPYSGIAQSRIDARRRKRTERYALAN